MVGSCRAERNQIDIGRTHAGGLHCASRRGFGRGAGGLTVRGDLPALDAGASANPLMRRVDPPLKVAIGEHSLRKVRGVTENS